jgi:branched-subunit amino acid ABC-type transport system permease component
MANAWNQCLKVYTGVFVGYGSGLAERYLHVRGRFRFGWRHHWCFIIVVIGGLGSLSGAFIGAIILGLGLFWHLIFETGCGLCAMLMIVIDYPAWGLMGKPE